ncbi:MAG: aspartate aminotransferase family protein, partial [Planctomycetota bacterium]
IGGIVTISVGHCHPKVIEKTRAQMEKLQHTTTIYLHPNLGALARKLASKMPEGLEVTYFVNSGSEANDLAMLMARLYTGNYDMIALKNCYHGAVSSVLGLTSHYTWKYPVPHGHGIHHVPCPDPYRSPFAGDDEKIAQKSADEIRSTIQYGTCGKIAGIIVEPIQGVGGTTAGPKSFYQKAYEIACEHGGIYISDEVQTGFGRTGDHYWGFENYDLKPHMVTMAKGLGNGIPIAAVTTTKEIAATMAQKIHFNTFGGNPVSTAQALAVLEVIDEENLQENAKVVGTYFKEGMKKLQEKYSLIGDVRGKGLMLGMEFVKNRESKEPATEETALFVEECKKLGVLLGKGGLFGNVLRIKPPMCITKEDANFALAVFEKVLEKMG